MKKICRSLTFLFIFVSDFTTQHSVHDGNKLNGINLNLSNILAFITNCPIPERNCVVILYLRNSSNPFSTPPDGLTAVPIITLYENSSTLDLINSIEVAKGCRLFFNLLSFYNTKSSSNANPRLKIETMLKFVVYKILPKSKFSSSQADEIAGTTRIFLDHEEVFSVCTSCGLCFHCPISTTVHQIQNACSHKIMGQGALGYFQTDASTTTVMISKNKPDCEKNTMLEIREPVDCTYSEVIVRILGEKLNVTFSHESAIIPSFASAEDDMEEDQLHGGVETLFLNVESGFFTEEDLVGGRSHSTLTGRERYFALYCTQITKYQSPSWFVLFSSFDSITWICLQLSGLGVGLLFNNSGAGFDTFLQLLGQRGILPWGHRNKLFLGLLLLNIFVLNQIYQCEETTKLTAPLPTNQIVSAKQLFQSGYRSVLPDMQTAQFGAHLVQHRYKKLDIAWSPEKVPTTVISKELNINEPMKSWWFWLMAKNQWITMMSDQIFNLLKQSGFLFKNHRVHNVSCYVVKDDRGDDDQHLFQRDNWYMTKSSGGQGALGQKAFFILEQLVVGGMVPKWKQIYTAHGLRWAEIKKSSRFHANENEDEGSYAPLKIQSPFQVLLLWHFIFCMVGIVAFLRECTEMCRNCGNGITNYELEA